MKKLFFPILVLIGSSLALKAQESIKPLTLDLLAVSGPQSLPDLKVTPVFGGEISNLAKIKPSDLKHPGKPTILISWAKVWCPPCIKRIDSLAAMGFDKDFNVIVVNVEDYSNRPDDKKSPSVPVQELAKFITEKQGWDRFLHLQANLDAYENVFNFSSTPQWVFLDKNLVIQDAAYSYNLPLAAIREQLNNIDQEKNPLRKEGPYYFNKNYLRCEKYEAAIYIMKTVTAENTLVYHHSPGNHKLLSEYTYKTRGCKIIVDGALKLYHDDGTVQIDALAVNGVIRKAKVYDENKLLTDEFYIPETGSGYSTAWTKNGKKKEQKSYLNGKLDGVTKIYDENGELIEEWMYKNDEPDGTKRTYKGGKLVDETLYKNGNIVVLKGNENIMAKYDVVNDFRDGLAYAKSNGKWGVINKEGEEIIPVKYDNLVREKDFCYVKLNGKYGVISNTGKMIFPVKYDSVLDVNYGFNRVKLDNKYGFLDDRGKEITPAKYDKLILCQNAPCVVQIGGKQGYIDENGKEITPIKYDYISKLFGSIAWAKLDRKIAYLNGKGKEITPFIYDDPYQSNGKVLLFSNGAMPVKREGKWGFMDMEGKEFIRAAYDEVKQFNQSGLASVRLDTVWYTIDKKGEIVSKD